MWNKGDRVYVTSKAGNIMAGQIESDIERVEKTEPMRRDPSREITYVQQFADVLVILPENDSQPANSFTSERRNLAFVTRRDELIEGIDTVDGKVLTLDEFRRHALNIRLGRAQAVEMNVEDLLLDAAPKA